jgi:hypothetical protein
LPLICVLICIRHLEIGFLGPKILCNKLWIKLWRYFLFKKGQSCTICFERKSQKRIITLFLWTNWTLPKLSKLRRTLLKPDNLVCGRHQCVPGNNPQNLRRQLNYKAHKWSNFHFQPSKWPTLSQNNPHIYLGGLEETRLVGQMENSRRSGSLDKGLTRRGITQIDYCH